MAAKGRTERKVKFLPCARHHWKPSQPALSTNGIRCALCALSRLIFGYWARRNRLSGVFGQRVRRDALTYLAGGLKAALLDATPRLPVVSECRLDLFACDLDVLERELDVLEHELDV